MKKIIAILAGLMLFGTLCFAADPAEGYWVSVDEKTNEETAGWKIYQEGGKLYGKILSISGKPKDEKATGGKGKSYDNFMNGRCSTPDKGIKPRHGCRHANNNRHNRKSISFTSH